MSKKDKSLHEKVKQFFGKREATTINFDKLRKEPFVLSIDALKDVSSESIQSQRLKALKELYDIVETKELENCALEALCKNIEDLLDLQNSIETRHIVLQFYSALIHGQLEHMTIMRTYLFRLIVNHTVLEDTLPRLDMLKALSQNGKTISYFEEEIGPFLLSWFSDVISAGKTVEFLQLVTNVIKFNAAYLDERIIAGFIECTYHLCCRTKFEEDIQESLNVLEAVLCYSHLPHYVLQHFVCTLCLTANIEKFSPCSWKQMRNLLGTNIGHTCIFTLCLILQDKNNYTQPSIVRSAVFFVSMSLWGSNRVPSLTHPPTAVLPSFLKVLNSNNTNIAYEIILSLQRLVKSGEQLRNLCWEMIFDILEKILEYAEVQENNHPTSVLTKSVHDFLTVVEEIYSESSSDRLFKIIESCADARSEQSVIRVIQHKAESFNPFKSDFFTSMNVFLEKYFKNERRPILQLEALKVIRNLRSTSRHFFEDDLIDQTILQFISHADNIPDVSVRRAAVEVLIEIAESSASNLFFDVLDVIEKTMKRMFESFLDAPDTTGSNVKGKSYADVLTAIEGLVNMFKRKLFTMPSNHCIEIYNVLINHIQRHYEKLFYSDEIVQIRKKVFEFLLSFRCNSEKQIGFCMEGTVEYSVYISCDIGENKDSNESASASPNPSTPSVVTQISSLSFHKAFQVLITCLKEEKDWEILEMILKELPAILQNKSLIIRGNCSVPALCTTLCTMVIDRNMGFPESLKNAPSRLTRTEVQSQIFPSVSALTSYHSHLESHMQRLLIKCLQSGLVSRSAKVCMEGLTLCTLEMQNSMVKLLPDVLLKLSKISATVGVSVSVLEFLSNLIRLPRLYISFVEDQYMSIFAIALPYTNPFKFSQYTVALSHHVIAMWFLKCRIPFRKDFAKFITKGLRSNINVPREESQRSSSSRKDDSSGSSEDNSLKKKEMSNSAIVALHTELMETGLDLMARFTFGMSSNVPKRSPVSEFLLEKGQKTSWLIGNKIVTITTSGCGTKSFKHGLCEGCYSSCREISKSMESGESDSIFKESEVPVKSSSTEFSSKRKRHRSAVQRRNTTLTEELLTNSNQTKDDILLHFQRLQAPDGTNRRHTSYFPNEDSPFHETSEDWTIESTEKENKSGHLCSCWCTSWSEVHIRRPTGNTSWMMKIQNHLFLPSSPPEIPLSVLSSLVLPQKAEKDLDNYLLSSTEDDYLDILESELEETSSSGAIEIASCSKSVPPMRRTNSSPDMSTAWSNFEPVEHEEKRAVLEDSMGQQVLGEDQKLPERMHFSPKLPEVESHKRNLKLNITSDDKNAEFSQKSGLKFERESINSAPIEQQISQDFLQSTAAAGFRDRGHTISVMSPIRPMAPENSQKRPELNRRSGMSPSFVFLQLFHNSCFGPATHKPLLLLQTETNIRALNVLDHIPPYDTHKIGVVYVGPGQVDSEVAILNNVYGSARYVNFLRGLGNLVRLTDVDPQTTYLGGLDTRGEDGKFALIWHDDVMQVVFHVSTLMFNKESDTMRTEKKKHIANDSVMIVYNESGEDYKLSTIKGHVTNACVVIEPEDFSSNVVSVKYKTKELMETFGHTESYIVSNDSLPVFIRQMALHANLASLIISRRQQSAKYSHVSNWLERLRTIKRLRSKVIEELKSKNEGFESSNDAIDFDDFTDYV